MKRLLKGAGLLFALLLAVCLARVALLPDPAVPGEAIAPIELDDASAVARMAGALRIATISRAEPGGIAGQALWRPAALGIRPRYESDAMKRALAGGFFDGAAAPRDTTKE